MLRNETEGFCIKCESKLKLEGIGKEPENGGWVDLDFGYNGIYDMLCSFEGSRIRSHICNDCAKSLMERGLLIVDSWEERDDITDERRKEVKDERERIKESIRLSKESGVLKKFLSGEKEFVK